MPECCAKLTDGRKQSHWMWFIFPQLAGLGSSYMAQKYAIDSLAEARSYLEHNLLGPRLRECTRLLLAIPNCDIHSDPGTPRRLEVPLIHDAVLRRQPRRNAVR